MRLNVIRFKPVKNRSKKYKRIRERFDKKDALCQWCDIGYGERLHHVDCNQSNDNEENLLWLCKKCNDKVHRIFPNWSKLDDSDIIQIIGLGKKMLKQNHEVILEEPVIIVDGISFYNHQDWKEYLESNYD